MAIINAYKAYSLFLEIKNSMGDNFQKLLWASTSVKAKDLEQDYYSINLPFENTVNTLPLETIDYLLKSDLNFTSESNLSKNFNKLYRESKDYFDFQKVTESLLKNGINLFQDSYKSVLDTIDQKVSKLIKK